MRYLKFGLIFDFIFFPHLDLYQFNKTLLKLTFTVFFFIPRIYYPLGNNSLIHRFKNYFRET